MSNYYAETYKLSAVTTTRKGLAELGAAATVAPKLYDFTISCSGTPADNVVFWSVMRFSASASATTFTPTSISQSPGIVTPIAALAWAAENQSATGTVTAASELFDQGINQRAAYRWVAAPGGEIQLPAIASNGVYVGALSTAYTGQADCTLHHME